MDLKNYAKEDKKLKEETKKLSVKEGMNYSVMDGAGLRYITPYALSIGANNTQIGLLTSIPSLLGNLSQLLTPKAIEKTSRKKIILTGVLLQAIMWIPIIILGYLFFYKNIPAGLSATLMIVFFTLLTLFGSFLSPAWNSMMKDVVGKKTGKYFGNRNKILGIITLAVMLICGFILNYFKKIDLLFFGFAIIFGIALISRLVSWKLLKKHYDPKFKFQDKDYFNFKQFIKRIPKSNFGKFAVFVSLIMFGTYIASPFFSVYLLKNLQLDYATWIFITISNPLSTLIFMPMWGKFADRFGNLKVLKWTGALISLIPIAYFFTMFIPLEDKMLLIPYLFVIEFFSGFIWSGFNLSAVNFIYDAVTRQKLALCVAYYNIFNGLGVFIGATLGGLISSINFNFLGVNSILFIFLLSAFARFMVYIFMIPKINEVRNCEEYKKGEFRNEIKGMFVPIYNRLGIKPFDRNL